LKSKFQKSLMPMLKALIVDDEKNCRDSLKILLEQHCADTVIIQEMLNSVNKAETWLRANRPDIIFLDISLPPTNGFELLKSITDPTIQIIFTTAFSEYAIKALRARALDYLLKPINPKELVTAVASAGTKLRDGIKNPDARISIPLETGSIFIHDKDIVRLEAQGKKTHIILKKNNPVISNRSIGYFENLLSEKLFFRVHREYVICMAEVKEYIESQTGAG
jgi:two-component system, LytTR family, response regulator